MQETTFYRVVIAISVIVAVLLIAGGLAISHKIAGPIYRMQKELTKMAESEPFELQSIQFRKGDYFPELAAAFNRLVLLRKNRP